MRSRTYLGARARARGRAGFAGPRRIQICIRCVTDLYAPQPYFCMPLSTGLCTVLAPSSQPRTRRLVRTLSASPVWISDVIERRYCFRAGIPVSSGDESFARPPSASAAPLRRAPGWPVSLSPPRNLTEFNTPVCEKEVIVRTNAEDRQAYSRSVL